MWTDERSPMDLRVLNEDVSRIETDALVVNLFEGAGEPAGATKAVDTLLDGAIKSLIDVGEIKGKAGEMVLIHTLGKMPARRVVVAGLGKQEKFNLDRVRRLSGEVVRFLRARGVKNAATICHGAGVAGIDPTSCAQAIAEGSLMGLYTFKKYMSKKDDAPDLDTLCIVEREAAKITDIEAGLARGRVLSAAVNWARDLINEPANYMTPSDMARQAEKLAADYKLGVEVLGRKEMQEMGMGALLGVAQGSHQEPKFIILRYRGNPDSEKTVALVGKGITFDSGGISLKPSEGMGEMKGDMAGGATVMAVIRALAALEVRINATALVPATENLPGGSALKPGDVLKAMSGKTIEIVNTDAEGRLILADALSYAKKQGLSPIIDVATLTGACRIALGAITTGLFTNDQSLGDRMLACSRAAGEYMWQLPMFEEYKEQFKSDVADIKNTGGRFGGAITAALILNEFSEDTPWVHLDIAGTAETDKDRGYQVKGATGVAVRSIVELVSSLERTGL